MALAAKRATKIRTLFIMLSLGFGTAQRPTLGCIGLFILFHDQLLWSLYLQ